MNKSLLLATVASLVTSTAFAAEPMQRNNTEVNYKDDGGYTAEKNVEKVDSNGVKHTMDSKTGIDFDANGNMKKTVVNADQVRKGVLHSKEDTSKTEYQQTNDGGYTTTKTSAHTNTDGTNLKTISKTHASIDSNGNELTVIKTQNTIDPPGLMNKTTSTAITKTVNGVTVEDQTRN